MGSWAFFHPDAGGWVVADLDTGRAAVHDAVVMVMVDEYSDASNYLGRPRVRAAVCGEGPAGDGAHRYVLPWRDVVPLVRDHPDGVTVQAVYEADGRVTLGDTADKVFRTLADVARSAAADPRIGGG